MLDAWESYQKGKLTPQELGGAIRKHHDLFLEAFGKDECKPKHHFAQHLEGVYRRFGMLQTTLVHERRHKAYKEVATSIKIGVGFGDACTRKLLNKQLVDLQDPQQFARGVFLGACWAKLPDTLIGFLPRGEWAAARTLVQHGLSTSLGDVIAVEQGSSISICCVEALLQRNQQDIYICARTCIPTVGGRWQKDRLALLDVSCNQGPCTWATNSEGHLHVLLPGHLRWRQRG